MKYLSKYARFIVVLVLMGHHGYCANNNNGSNILVDAINTTGEVTERIVTNLANNAAQAIKEGQARRSTLAQEVRNLSNQHYSYFYGWSQQRHKDDYDKKIEEMAQIDQNKKDARSFLSDTVVKGGLELMKQKTLGDAEVKAAVAKAAVDNQGALDRLNKLLEPENLKRFAVYGSLAIGLGAGAYYGVKFGYNYAESLVGKPSLVREWSYHDLKSRIKDYFYYTLLGNKRPVVENLNSLVFSPAIDAEIRRIVPEIKNNLALGLPLQNYAFYGPPGTGKTETARAIARECGLNYIIISTPDLDQFKGGDRVFEFNKLFNVIEGDHNWVWDIVEFSSNDKNDGPFLVFFDESDTGFRDRATLDKDAIAVVNTFLSHTGTSSTKFMIIMATNYENELDAAVRSRLHKKLLFDLPGADERRKILQIKIDRYILNDNRTYKNKAGKMVNVKLTVAQDINHDYLEKIVAMTEGFSGRDLDQLVAEIRQRAYGNGTNIVTKEICDNIIANKVAQIKKDQETTRWQHARFARKEGLPSPETIKDVPAPMIIHSPREVAACA